MSEDLVKRVRAGVADVVIGAVLALPNGRFSAAALTTLQEAALEAALEAFFVCASDPTDVTAGLLKARCELMIDEMAARSWSRLGGVKA
ncbi:MAG: hypothetical protein GC145_14505 [Caulobacter sp.]|nr:hypothetical protein [Caulobacter sp.]